MNTRLIAWHLYLKRLMSFDCACRKMSNSTHGFIINPQLDIQSTDEYRIKISGSAVKCELGQSFHHSIHRSYRF